MRTEKEIMEQRKEYMKDERLYYPCAEIEVNAPLALHQLEVEGRLAMLDWVLELPPEDTFSAMQKRFREVGEL